ncbi:uncharacterized protein LOC130054953 [Ostrea edulis]|uniref:uncharacterized protein LOC130054953 n=1 Tax=Ostrea edulis TaxID=37623 RepID=UPI0024AFD60C|nr:uncharacterized protein LOC130054953 [Ostrea edulis]
MTYRKFKAIDSNALSQAVTSSTLCSSAAIEKSLIDLTELYSSKLSSIMNSFTPPRTRTVTIRPESEWYNSFIIEAKQRRRQVERLAQIRTRGTQRNLHSAQGKALDDETKRSHFHHVTVDEVTKLIRSSANKSCELDPMPTSFVKQEVTALAPVITCIINKLLESDSFPTHFKGAIVTPLLKKASLDPDRPENYRPVSSLAYLSKLIEKVVAAQIQTYLSENNLLEPFQSAYPQGHSTETALLRVHNDVVRAIGEQKAVLLVQLDLSAAFDIVDHSRLLQILKDLGIKDTVIMWFASYITNRTQILNCQSEGSEVWCHRVGLLCPSEIGPRDRSVQHLHSIPGGPSQIE